jgi:hypothetical protein
MAIVFEQQRKPVNWIAILSIIFIVTFIIVVAYYIFFAATPKIDQIGVLPEPLERAGQISNLGEFLEPNAVVGARPFTDLKPLAPQPTIGAIGRSNPFAPF